MKPRSDTLVAMREVMGPLPDASSRIPLDVRTVERFTRGGLAWRKVTFAVEPGDRCVAWLIVPVSRHQEPPGPAVLCLHQTTRIGKDEPVGRGGEPNFHYALELAQRGSVVLVPDYPGFGEYFVDAYALGYASVTAKGVWNHMRALDLLAGEDTVDASRIGCIGHSLGGHNALFLAAFDGRVRAVVSSCGFTRWSWNDNEGRGARGDMTDWCQPKYMPRIAERYGSRAENMPFEMEDVLAVIAPRPLFINASLHDFFQPEGVDECVELMRPIYGKAGASDAIVCEHPDCGHDFPEPVRERAYQFLARHLQLEQSDEIGKRITHAQKS